MITRADSEVLRLARALVRAEEAKAAYWNSAETIDSETMLDHRRDVDVATERLIRAAMAAYGESER